MDKILKFRILMATVFLFGLSVFGAGTAYVISNAVRSNIYHIGSNGNWYIGNNDTNIPAKGKDGANGKDGVTYIPVVFYDYDRVTKLDEQFVIKGTNVTYNGKDPSRESDEKFDYKFNGWDKSLDNITEPTFVYATYEASSRESYKVTFKDVDGSILQESYVTANTAAKYDKDEPFNYTSDKVNIFKGWDKDISNITQDMTVTAQYLSLDRKRSGEYPQTKVTNQLTIDKLNALTTSDSEGYYRLGNERYQKENDSYFKVEPIQWHICGKSKSGRYLLCSKYILDYKEFYIGSLEYQNNKIRNYLNGSKPYNVGEDESFIGKAFSDSSLLCNFGDITGINGDLDKVSLLSREDCDFNYINKYPTDYTKYKCVALGGSNDINYCMLDARNADIVIKDSRGIHHMYLTSYDRLTFGIVPTILVDGINK